MIKKQHDPDYVFGRPSKVTREQKLEIYEAFEKWIETEDNPLINGFCFNDETAKKYGVIDHNLRDWGEPFSMLIKRALHKQEVYYEIQTAAGKIPPAWAIFKMKQPAFGWTDKQQLEHSGEMTVNNQYNPETAKEFESWLKGKDTNADPR